MKAGLFTIAALAAAATAQVHHGHRRHEHKRRNNALEVEVVTVNAPDVVVYVDHDGQLPAPPASNPVEPGKPKKNPPPAAPKSVGGVSDHGISYSPYHDNGDCKKQHEVDADFELLIEYSFIRIYGCDCDQLTTVTNAARAKGKKVFAGIFDINQVKAETEKIIAAVKDDWRIIKAISVGNEIVNAGGSVAAVVSAVKQTKEILAGAGYKGEVAAVDTFVAVIAHPELCEVSDFAAVNCHAYFDGSRTAEQAGEFVQEQVQRVAAACPGKRVVVTESGWPHSGKTNNLAIASKEEQKKAIDSLKSKFSKNIVFFTPFDDLWKHNSAGTLETEQCWGFIKHTL